MHRKLTKREFKRREKAAFKRKMVKMSAPKTYERPELFKFADGVAEDTSPEETTEEKEPANIEIPTTESSNEPEESTGKDNNQEDSGKENTKE